MMEKGYDVDEVEKIAGAGFFSQGIMRAEKESYLERVRYRLLAESQVEKNSK